MGLEIPRSGLKGTKRAARKVDCYIGVPPGIVALADKWAEEHFCTRTEAMRTFIIAGMEKMGLIGGGK